MWQVISRCTWQACESTPMAYCPDSTFTSLDVLFRGEIEFAHSAWSDNPAEFEIDIETSSKSTVRATSERLGGFASLQFLLQCIGAASSPQREHGRMAKFLLPRSRGHIVRADIVSMRLMDCELVESAVDFGEPRQFYAGHRAGHVQLQGLEEIFTASAAGLLLLRQDDGVATMRLASQALEEELRNRLSLPCILTDVQSHPTLAIVEGSRVHPVNGGTGPSIYLAAKALGIDVVVLDNAGHWLEGPDYAHWRLDFIPIQLIDPPDTEFTSRIVRSVLNCGRRIDGIITFCDSYMTHVAKAVQQLGLPT